MNVITEGFPPDWGAWKDPEGGWYIVRKYVEWTVYWPVIFFWPWSSDNRHVRHARYRAQQLYDSEQRCAARQNRLSS